MVRARKLFVQNLQEVFHRLPAALAEYDAQGRLVLWNQAYADLVGSYGVEPQAGLPRGIMHRPPASWRASTSPHRDHCPDNS